MSSDAKAKGADNECIQVVVRCRPLNKKENEEKRLSIIDVDTKLMQVSIKNPDQPNETPKYFTYDAAYDENTQQRIFYDESCFGVIEGTLEGFNSTIFAYGQTGCGKSFTMQGPSTTVDHLKGVTPNSFSHIFQFVKASKDIEFLIRCSYLELYNEEIKDLLGNSKQPQKCELKEDPQKGVYVKGLTDVVVESAEDLNNMLDKGLQARTVASTNMNAESSRSHSIFTIIVEMNTKDAVTGKDMLRVGKLNLVDLAGSERQKKTGATGSTQKEGIKINLSLSALGNVISALSEGSRHVPYRDSKLTRLLQDSLGGNTKTMMIAAISPADYNYEETMSTLRYANRAKNIKNKPKINEDPKDTMIREFKEEIERLRKMLVDQAAGGGSFQMPAAMMASMVAVAGPGATVATVAPVASVGAAQSAQTAHSAPVESDGFHASSMVTVKNDEVDFSSTAPIRTISTDEDNINYSPDKDHLGATYTGTATHAQLEHQASSAVLREEVENRLHQLEGMLVSNPNGELGHSLKLASSSSAAYLNGDTTEVVAPTAEEIEEEEEAARVYQVRREEARRKKEIHQAKELQRIVEEKRAMEEELEDLRASTTRGSSGAANASMGLHGTSPSPSTGTSLNNMASAQIAEVTATLNKKMSRMKKRYEKKLAEAKEALEDLQEDFSYQRKQFMDAATEQEKDVRLYELICQSVLSEKDLKKMIEKCRYDEDADEWIVPFAKKKTITDSQWQSANQSQHHGHSERESTNRSLFPDIGAAPSNMTKGQGQSNSGSAHNSGNNLQALGSTLRDPSKIPKNHSEGRHSPVPLLTLPGNLSTPSSVLAPVQSHSARKNEPKGSLMLPQISGRSDNNTGRNGVGADYSYDSNHSAFGQVQILPTQGVEKKKKKNRLPKGAHPSGSGPSNGVGYSATSARDSGDDYPDISELTNNDVSGNSAQYGYGGVNGVAESKAASQESAGPLEDWGFTEGAPASHGRGKPELEYSDDEDFESAEDIIHSSQYKSNDGPYPPAYGGGGNGNGGKKKKKKKSSDDKPASAFLPPI